ncbi:hypothetical protein [Paraburkholderia phytofirmans]|uniref:hypothetical protein n=1 Tax=Paraburkholderia phytofirmans TaxID=261302 RepID=UPI0013140E73|nr:hypothetical protein [Paraburkholderia phytofirmans]
MNHFSESIRSVPRRSAECPGLDWSLQSGARHAMEFFDHALFCIRELLVQARQHTSRFRRVDAHRPRRVDSLLCPSDFDGQFPTHCGPPTLSGLDGGFRNYNGHSKTGIKPSEPPRGLVFLRTFYFVNDSAILGLNAQIFQYEIVCHPYSNAWMRRDKRVRCGDTT